MRQNNTICYDGFCLTWQSHLKDSPRHAGENPGNMKFCLLCALPKGMSFRSKHYL